MNGLSVMTRMNINNEYLTFGRNNILLNITSCYNMLQTVYPTKILAPKQKFAHGLLEETQHLFSTNNCQIMFCLPFTLACLVRMYDQHQQQICSDQFWRLCLFFLFFFFLTPKTTKIRSNDISTQHITSIRCSRVWDGR